MKPATVSMPPASMRFFTTGPEAVDFFTTKTAVHFDMPLIFPDYHAEAPGGAQGGRSMVTRPFDGRELGPHIRISAPPCPNSPCSA